MYAIEENDFYYLSLASISTRQKSFNFREHCDISKQRKKNNVVEKTVDC